ncbi:hypothetical protein C1H46_026164 [Malus baccata]|uniref:Uncharacterized protein n=1 Tax=Malus baccata TaxID=106549 RepID=A0A540LP80_MALBA|nr:hypothetical protein C1H46_026164 [Malus baccata]
MLHLLDSAANCGAADELDQVPQLMLVAQSCRDYKIKVLPSQLSEDDTGKYDLRETKHALPLTRSFNGYK